MSSATSTVAQSLPCFKTLAEASEALIRTHADDEALAVTLGHDEAAFNAGLQPIATRRKTITDAMVQMRGLTLADHQARARAVGAWSEWNLTHGISDPDLGRLILAMVRDMSQAP